MYTHVRMHVYIVFFNVIVNVNGLLTPIINDIWIMCVSVIHLYGNQCMVMCQYSDGSDIRT